MADGSIVPSQRRWEGAIELGGIMINGGFEVFNSKGGWDFLFGKPLLRQFKAVHDYRTGTITIKHPQTGHKVILHNQLHLPIENDKNEKDIHWTSDIEQWGNTIGGTSGKNPPLRQVPNNVYKDTQPICDKSMENIGQQTITENEAAETTPTTEKAEDEMETHSNHSGGKEQPPSREVIIDLDVDCQLSNTNDVHHVTTADTNGNIYTRYTDPFKQEHVTQVLSEVTIGPDITPEEHRGVRDLIAGFADCFALAMSEVNTVPGAVHKLNILPETKFHTRIGQ
jgi:hypothetical protein